MTDLRENNLPKWAQELLKNLRFQLETALEPAVQARRKLEVAEERCRRQASVLDALQELLFTAAKGGHKTAHEIVTVLHSYEIFKSTEVSQS